MLFVRVWEGGRIPVRPLPVMPTPINKLRRKRIYYLQLQQTPPKEKHKNYQISNASKKIILTFASNILSPVLKTSQSKQQSYVMNSILM